MPPFPTGEGEPDHHEGYGPDDFEQERYWQSLAPLRATDRPALPLPHLPDFTEAPPF